MVVLSVDGGLVQLWCYERAVFCGLVTIRCSFAAVVLGMSLDPGSIPEYGIQAESSGPWPFTSVANLCQPNCVFSHPSCDDFGLFDGVRAKNRPDENLSYVK
ncbi:hypothetical protein Ancab_038202 [Ancistrocladus abbreviatus]